MSERASEGARERGSERGREGGREGERGRAVSEYRQNPSLQKNTINST